MKTALKKRKIDRLEWLRSPSGVLCCMQVHLIASGLIPAGTVSILQADNVLETVEINVTRLVIKRSFEAYLRNRNLNRPKK